MHWDLIKHLTQYCYVLLFLSISGVTTGLAGDPLEGNSLAGVSKIDSLWQVFAKTDDDSMRATLLLDISDVIDDTSATEAIIYTLQAHDLFKNNGDELPRARTLNTLGYYHWSLGAFDDANKYYHEALLLAEAHADSLLIATVANNLGVSNWGLSNYNAALPHFQRALEIRKQKGESKGVALILNNIGLIYQEWGLFEKALQFHEEALDISISSHQLSARAYSYNNIGRCQESMNDYESALRYFQLSLQDYLAEGSIGAATSLCYYDIGNVYYTLSQLDSALTYYQQSWRHAAKVKNKHRKTIAENKIAVTFAALGQYDEAEEYVGKSLRTAQSQHYYDLVRDNHYLLSEIAEGRGDISGAYQYYKTASMMNDSLFNSESLAKFTELQVKYSIEKEVSENLELTARNEIQQLGLIRNKLYTNILIILSFFILIVAALIYNRSRILKRSRNILKIRYDDISSLNTENESLISKLEQEIDERQQVELELQNSDSMKTLLLDIITHDLRNPAGVIQSVSMILREEIPDNEMIELVHSSSNRLMGVMENTTTLAKTASGERIEREIHSLSKIIKEVVNDFSSQLSTAGMALSINLESELQVRVNPIISEVFANYLSNIIKYASATNQIIIDAEDDDAITIRVKDEGETILVEDRENIFLRSYQLSKEEKRGRGLGLAIVKRIAAAHDGEVWVEPNIPRGNSFCLRIPR